MASNMQLAMISDCTVMGIYCFHYLTIDTYQHKCSYQQKVEIDVFPQKIQKNQLSPFVPTSHQMNVKYTTRLNLKVKLTFDYQSRHQFLMNLMTSSYQMQLYQQTLYGFASKTPLFPFDKMFIFRHHYQLNTY